MSKRYVGVVHRLAAAMLVAVLAGRPVAAQVTLDYAADVKPIHAAFVGHCMDDLERHLSLLFQSVEHDVGITQVAKGNLAKQIAIIA